MGVPGVFTERDPEARLRMLMEHPRSWRMAQPLYALGPIVAAAGVGALVGETSVRGAKAALAAACLALLVGAAAWTWAVYLRATRVDDFAFGRQPGWPFATYVLLTLAGLALLGIGLLLGDFAAWAGWLTLGADAFFLAIYLKSGDIPPFVFYLLLAAVGIAVL